MSKTVSPQRMSTIDPTSYELWNKFVKPFVGRSRRRTNELRCLFEKGPMPGTDNPIAKKIISNRLGMEDFQTAMMTWAYLAAMCRHHERCLGAKR